MAPAAIVPEIVDVIQPKQDKLGLPAPTKARLEKADIDLSKGYPDVFAVRDYDRPFVDAGSRADPAKKSLLSAAKEVIHLTTHIGTEIARLQLKDLTDQQRDELALLVAERSVVFFRNQDLSPQKQLELGHYYGEVEVHPQVPCVPGLPGTTVIWPQLAASEKPTDFRNPIIDGKYAVYRSAHTYLDREDPTAGPKFIERSHPLVRTHPATGWKALYVNRAMTDRIVGLDKGESDAILQYLCQVYEGNVDIQCRFKWTPGTSALWDNRITMHNASYDYEGLQPRHGTRVTSLAEKPFFDHNAPTRRQALGIAGAEE
ncbi:hypothetical protein B0A50_05978 [Salinomyces thailandicus]|uniref:TauD/TfdA-like domain-containing protein n=1 Tax=Salinomyces thailandicus TaxID=706561 RepID=A0A4U0TQ77_9PEZI|nr:hypothetical protein B0A50_05978 [Salinomyces thailandica]